MKSLTFAERIIYSTTRITGYRGGGIVGTGTGFFYNLEDGPDRVHYLMLTNKHVVEGVTEVAIKFHIGAEGPDHRPSGKVVDWRIDIRTHGIKDHLILIDHPNEGIDLCAINLTGALNDASSKGYRVFATPMARQFIPGPADWQSFDALEEVTMIGCPRGIYDEVNNIPIMRRGITATPILKDFDGKPEFLVDMACFGGSSGSPIFLLNRNGYFDTQTKQFRADHIRFHLVGILHAGPLARARGHVVAEGTPSVEVATTMHLGYAIRSTQILGVEAEFRRRLAVELARRSGGGAPA